MHPSHTKIEPTVLIGPLCSDLPEKVRIDPRRISCRCIYILESFCFRFGSETNCLPHLLVYFCCVRDGTQRLLTHRGLWHKHTHMFKVTLIGRGRLTWRSHYTGLSGVDCGVTDILLKCLMWPWLRLQIKNTQHTRHGIEWQFSLLYWEGFYFLGFLWQYSHWMELKCH